MKKVLFLLCLTLAFSAPVYAREVVLVMKNSDVVKGDMIGTNETLLFMNENGKVQKIKLADIQEVFDAQTNERIQVATPSPPPPANQPGYVLAEDGTLMRGPITEGPFTSGSFEIYSHGSFFNSYVLGDQLKNWMHSDMRDNFSGFADLGFNCFYNLDSSRTMSVGWGMSMSVPYNSIRGTDPYGNELDLYPLNFSFDLPFRYTFKNTGLSLTLAPSFAWSVIFGTYTTSQTDYPDEVNKTTDSDFVLGAGLSLGAEYYFGNFGLGAKCGFIKFLPESESLGFENVNNGPFPLIDFSSTYATFGVMYKFDMKYQVYIGGSTVGVE